jgi:hypothetical protein
MANQTCQAASTATTLMSVKTSRASFATHVEKCLAVQVSTDHTSAYRHIKPSHIDSVCSAKAKNKNASLSACQRLQQDAREHTCSYVNHYLQHGSLYIVLVGWVALRGMQLNSVHANSAHAPLCGHITSTAWMKQPIVNGYAMANLQTKMMSVRRRKPGPLGKLPPGA